MSIQAWCRRCLARRGNGQWAALLIGVALVAVACASSSPAAETAASGQTPTRSEAPMPTAPPTAAPTPTPTATPVPTATARADTGPVWGTVVAATDGAPLAGATVVAGSATTQTDVDGEFRLEDVAPGSTISVQRPAWLPSTTTASAGEPLRVALDPRIVRGLRVAAPVAADSAAFERLLRLADGSTVNALVFDTKDENDHVLYETTVPLANELDAVDPVYDPAVLLELAQEHSLYTITRIVTFEDPVWLEGVPEARLVGSWVDPTVAANWEYPLALAVEACALGFDEVQFDYVRYPAGEDAGRARHDVPATEQARTQVIAGFLDEARRRLHPAGCAVSAAVFGIVMSSETDERLGQTPETASVVVDAISPMLYPSHYSAGWLGFDDPNEHPGAVVADALDDGAGRLAPGGLVRPWLQGFFYDRQQVRAQIAEAEARGVGWMLWNIYGDYRRGWLPAVD